MPNLIRRGGFGLVFNGAPIDPRWALPAADALGAEPPSAPTTLAGHPKLRPQLFPQRAQAAG